MLPVRCGAAHVSASCLSADPPMRRAARRTVSGGTLEAGGSCAASAGLGWHRLPTLSASRPSAAREQLTAAAEPSAQPRLAPLLSRALVPQPVAQGPKHDQREPDLLSLPQPIP